MLHNRMAKLALLLLFPTLAQAGSYTFTKQVNLSVLEDEFVAAGYLVEKGRSFCDKGGCVVYVSDLELKDPGPVVLAHVYEDGDIRRALILSELRTLAPKYADNTATAAEMRRGLFLFFRLFRLGDK